MTKPFLRVSETIMKDLCIDPVEDGFQVVTHSEPAYLHAHQLVELDRTYIDLRFP